ncbi:MAG: hypothetical protein ACP5N7_01100 [Candidatus Pacearchaeota archaeon]
MSDPCNQEKAIDYIKERVDRIEDKVDSLLEFKNKALGMIIIITALIAFIEKIMINVISAIIK